MGTNSHNQIWQSPFMRYFASQQHFNWFRSQAASTVLFNVLAVVIVALERHYQFAMFFLPLLEQYSGYHSLICMAVMSMFIYNVLEFTIRYLHCCYKLSYKFVVYSEEAKQDILRSFNSPGTRGLVTVASGHASTSPPAPVRRSPSLLDSVYLPSAASAAAAAKPASPASTSPVGGLAGRYRPNQSLTTPPLPPPVLCWDSTHAANASCLQPAFHGSADFSHLARLRYQLGTPSPGTVVRQPPGNLAASPQQQQAQQQPAAAQQHVYPSSNALPPPTTLRVLLGSPELDRRWLRGMRNWLHGTLLEPLSRDVERVNARLLRDSQPLAVGSASPLQLQSSGGAVAAPLLPYLAVCEDQGYLVRRIQELASSPCLGAFRWDAGSPGLWLPDRHPSDAILVLQLLAAYLDRCLPPLPGNAKPFSAVYLLSRPPPAAGCSPEPQPPGGTPELRIVQAARQPPHFHLAMAAQPQPLLMDLPPGPGNLLTCLLLFFHHYQARGGGRLGPLSLGESGLNLAWIFEAGDSLDIEALLGGPL